MCVWRRKVKCVWVGGGGGGGGGGMREADEDQIGNEGKLSMVERWGGGWREGGTGRVRRGLGM